MVGRKINVCGPELAMLFGKEDRELEVVDVDWDFRMYITIIVDEMEIWERSERGRTGVIRRRKVMSLEGRI